jgi:hypothetical protein
VPIDPEVSHEDPVGRRLLRRAAVTAHPEGARRHEHHAVGAGAARQGEGRDEDREREKA